MIELCARREGVWDSGLVIRVSTFLMEGGDGGWVYS
jgi:hypothetical protein